MDVDELLLDDPDALIAADTRQLLVITASAGASMRASAERIDQDAVARIVADGRPSSVVVVGGGGSRIAGDILAAVAGSKSPVLIAAVGGPALPGWVGPTDLVVAVSAGGTTPETLEVANEAARRGCRLMGVCPSASRLGEVLERTRSAERFDVGIPPTGEVWQSRTLMWSLATPLLLVGGALGLVEDAQAAVTNAATALDDIADRCSPYRDSVTNLAKQWALDATFSLPMLWGSGDIGAVAVRRFGRQLAANAGLPAVVGTLPEAARTQSVLLAGPRAGASSNLDDIFRDRVDDPDSDPRLRLVLLRDADEHPRTAALADAAEEVALIRGVPTSVLRAAPGHPLGRLATLAGTTDFVSVYAALALGSDPMASANELDGIAGFTG